LTDSASPPATKRQIVATASDGGNGEEDDGDAFVAPSAEDAAEADALADLFKSSARIP
jgi:hypothetical protein